MWRVGRVFQYYLLGLIGILVISVSPSFFSTNGLMGFFIMIKEFITLIGELFQPSEWVYLFKQMEEPILPFLWEPYLYSMTILLSSLLLGFLLAMFLSAFTVFLPAPLRVLTKKVLHLFETIPDLLVAFLLQMVVVAVYKKTDILLFKFATLGDEKVYIGPILTLAILPMVSLYKIVLLLLEEELKKHYVQFAQSKGVKFRGIIVYHVFRNIVYSVFYHSKTIVWGALSSLLVIEYVFNTNGLTYYILQDFRPIVTAIVLWMIFTPFFFFYHSIEMVLKRNEVKTVTVKFKRTGIWTRIKRWPLWNLLWRGFVETLKHFKNVKFTLGFLVVFGMLGVSIYHSVTADVVVRDYGFIYDEDNKLVSTPPHAPEFIFMGTDRLGFSIYDQILTGAKYTILLAILISFLRVVGGLLLSIPYAFLMKEKWQERVDKFVDGFHYLPITLIALVILQPTMVQSVGGFETSLADRVAFEVVVLTVLSLPLLTALIGNESRLLLQREFVLGARVLGGDPGHLFWRHILPHLGSRLGILFGQQFIQTLIVFIHLGVFGLFVGGTITSNDPLNPDPPRSYSYEWSGLISSSKTALMSGNLWMIVPVLLSFVVLIIAVQFIVEGIKDVQQQRVGVTPVTKRKWRARLRKQKKTVRPSTETENDDFQFVRRTGSKGGR